MNDTILHEPKFGHNNCRKCQNIKSAKDFIFPTKLYDAKWDDIFLKY